MASPSAAVGAGDASTPARPGLWALKDETLSAIVENIESNSFTHKIILRGACRRLNWVVIRDPMFVSNAKFVNGISQYKSRKQKIELELEITQGDARESRGRFRLNAFIALNVVLGIAQLGVAAASLGKSCDEPVATVILICGIVNTVQVVSFALWGCPGEVLHPLDEYGDEEFGWPLYLVGMVVWISFIVDFTLWIVLQMWYFGTLGSCDDTLKAMTMATIVIRWVLFVSYFVISINHLMDKIHQENKRKYGRNPYKKYRAGKKIGGLFGQTSVAEDPEDGTAVANGEDSEANVAIEMSSGADLNSAFRSGARGDGASGTEITRKKAVTVM